MSHKLLLLLTVMLLGCVCPTQAQIFQITADGVTAQGFGIYSTVPSGTPFTFTATFNAVNATLVSSTSTSATYSDPTGTSTFSFDGINFSGNAPQILITSGELVDSTPIYGFEFSQSLTGGGGYAVQLLSIDSSVAPSISLESLHTSDVSDFFNSLNLAAVNSPGGNGTDHGTTTLFSVQIESAPEPSSTVLFALAIPLLWWIRNRQQRKYVAA